jgi:hypothetical protein
MEAFAHAAVQSVNSSGLGKMLSHASLRFQQKKLIAKAVVFPNWSTVKHETANCSF